jgi:hypothetical protein
MLEYHSVYRYSHCAYTQYLYDGFRGLHVNIVYFKHDVDVCNNQFLRMWIITRSLIQGRKKRKLKIKNKPPLYCTGYCIGVPKYVPEHTKICRLQSCALFITHIYIFHDRSTICSASTELAKSIDPLLKFRWMGKGRVRSVRIAWYTRRCVTTAWLLDE